MITVELEHRSAEWFQARAGIPTSCNFDKLITSEGAQSKQREKYIYQLAGERVSGKPSGSYQSQSMLDGIEFEAEARNFYEVLNTQVQKVGICYKDKEKLFSCSPDALVGKEGLLEIKCPMIHTHVDYILKQRLPVEYFQQVQGQLFITGRKWCDFMSYFPGIKPLIVRVGRDEKFIKALSAELKKACDEIESIARKIRR